MRLNKFSLKVTCVTFVCLNLIDWIDGTYPQIPSIVSWIVLNEWDWKQVFVQCVAVGLCVFPTCHDPSCEVYHCVTVYVIVFTAHSPIYNLRVFNQCLFAPWTDVYEDLQPLFVFTWVLCCLLWISCLAFSIVALANLLLGCHVFCIHLRYSMGTCCSVLPLCLDCGIVVIIVFGPIYFCHLHKYIASHSKSQRISGFFGGFWHMNLECMISCQNPLDVTSGA